jgi:mRNA interferase HigB
MKITNKKALSDFKASHPDAATQVDAWQAEAARATWATPNELKQQYGNASILKGSNVVFNICGNKYRLWVKIAFKSCIVFVKAIGTHKEYDSWDIR